ncbi:pantoate--beta-alanine ligase-like [Hibiscus syriacus]|uniref:Pantoate--beta-alanine ligase-like n=1 Tax=Hibiscus syriacus TaxID=106335 RepID=A0A6A2WNZ8_HIBSY|nr:pantoate--beta-alanine ligase-like [Hibiscus syriacus]
MSGLASAPTPTSAFPSTQQSKIRSKRCINPCNFAVIPSTKLCSSYLSLTSFSFGGAEVIRRCSVISRSSTGPGATGSGDNESRSVLDAFFLGKALAEALNERIESTIGEFFSVVGRLQAEQQKQCRISRKRCLKGQKEPKRKRRARHWNHKG